MKRREKKKFEGGSWMDTYGDMVTLLLCFFVLLYSISSVDTVKWQNLVKSLNPDADKVSRLVTDDNIPPGEQDVPGGSDLEENSEKERIDEEFDNLYDKLEKIAAESDGEVMVVKCADFVFVMFRDRIFFDGDSWVLREEGKKVIDRVARIIKPSRDSIKEVQIMGHTTQALPNKKNPIESDRTLSSMRSAVVTIYLQEEGVIEASKLVNLGYGQHHPVASFKTEKQRSMNRRVEFMISKTGGTIKSIEDYYGQIYGNKDKDSKKN